MHGWYYGHLPDLINTAETTKKKTTRAEIEKNLSHEIHGTGRYIYLHVYHKNRPNVGEYTSCMDPMGCSIWLPWIFHSQGSRAFNFHPLFGKLGSSMIFSYFFCDLKIIYR